MKSSDAGHEVYRVDTRGLTDNSKDFERLHIFAINWKDGFAKR